MIFTASAFISSQSQPRTENANMAYSVNSRKTFCLNNIVKNGGGMNESDFYHCFPGSCGVSSLGNSRVIGGDDAKPGAWPWQV